MQHKVSKKYKCNKRKQFTLDEVMSYVLEPGSESEMFELDSEDEDYVPEAADRFEGDVELNVERGENTEPSDDNEGGGLKMIMMLKILQMLMVMKRMTK